MLGLSLFSLIMNEFFRKFAAKASNAAGSPWAFLAAVTSILVWLITGPFFHWSESHQLSVNTGTTIITFLIVFLVQSSQNRDTRAVLLKLDELIRSSQASNRLIEIETKEESQVEEIKKEIREEIQKLNET